MEKMNLNISIVSMKAILKEIVPYLNDNEKFRLEYFIEEKNLKGFRDLVSVIEKENGLKLSRKLANK